METIQLNGRDYEVVWSEDTLIPENIRYVSDLSAWTYTPKGRREVTGVKKINQLAEIIQCNYVGR